MDLKEKLKVLWAGLKRAYRKRMIVVIDISTLDTEQWRDLHRYLANAPSFKVLTRRTYGPLCFDNVEAERPNNGKIDKLKLLMAETDELKTELDARRVG